MRLLTFNVDSQHIIKDPGCDFSGLVAGTRDYLKACFSFSPEWSDCELVASFWRGGKEHAARIVDGVCDIPPEALTGRVFSVSVTGQKGRYRITTNRVTVCQEVSK